MRRKMKRPIAWLLSMAMLLVMLPVTAFAGNEETSDSSMAVSVTNITAADSVYQGDPFSFSIQFSIQSTKTGHPLQKGDTISVDTNIVDLFDADWNNLQSVNLYSTNKDTILAKITVNRDQLCFTIEDIPKNTTEISGAISLPTMTAKDVGATAEHPVEKNMTIGSATAEIIFQAKGSSSGTDNSSVDIDEFWKSAWSIDNNTGATITMEVNPIGSMDLYGWSSNSNPQKRVPAVHDMLLVQDVIQDQGFIDIDSVQICAAISEVGTTTEETTFNTWYTVPAGTNYAKRHFTSRVSVIDEMEKLEQYPEESFEEFMDRIQQNGLQWGIYWDEETNTETFLCNFGRVGDKDSNNGLLFEDYAPQNWVEEYPEIFSEKGRTGGNIVTYFIQFNTYYPDIVGAKKVYNQCQLWTGDPANKTNRNEVSYLINNGGGTGVARKNQLNIQLVDANTTKTEEVGNTPVTYKQPIEGANFRLEQWNEDNNTWEEVPLNNMTTDENGRITVRALLPGKYRVVQISWVNGFVQDNRFVSSGNQKVNEVDSDGVFTVTGEEQFGFGAVVENWKPEVITVKPEDQTIYTGGTGGDAANNEFPHPIYLIQDVGELKDAEVSFKVNDAEWTETDENPYPFTVKYYKIDQEGNETEITTDENYGDYIAKIVPVAGVQLEDIKTADDKTVQFENGTLRIRYVSDYEEASHNALTEEAIYYGDGIEYATKEAAKTVAEGDNVAVILPQGTEIALNGNESYIYPDGTDSKIAILFDDLLPGDAADRAEALKAHAEKNGLNLTGKVTLFKYLDLVDSNNSNAWVSSSEGCDVFWPYPADTGKDTDFQLLHFEGLHREYSMENENSLAEQIEESAVTNVDIEKSDKGIWFHVEKSGFSPFALVWEPKEEQQPTSQPGLSVIKIADKQEIEPGETLTYTIMVKNTGNTVLNDITVTDTFDGYGGLQFILPESGVTANGNNSFLISSLGINEEITITATYEAMQEDEGKTLTNTVTATSEAVEDTDSVTVNVEEPDQPHHGGNSGSGSGGGGGSHDKPDDLNTEDHFSYIIGYPDGTIQPQGDITRAEVATIFFRMLTDEAREENWSQTNDYNDVTATDWYNNAISTLSDMGIIEGYPDGSFRPDAPITRAEFTKIAVGFFDEVGNYVAGTYSDVPADAWYADFIDAAVDLGLIEGYPDGTIRPNAPITRAESCTIVNRTLGRVPHEDHLLPEDEMNVWPDNREGAWYYEQMQEATNSHDYKWITVSGDEVEEWTEKLEDRDWAALEREWSDANSAPGGEVMD